MQYNCINQTSALQSCLAAFQASTCTSRVLSKGKIDIPQNSLASPPSQKKIANEILNIIPEPTVQYQDAQINISITYLAQTDCSMPVY